MSPSSEQIRRVSAVATLMLLEQIFHQVQMQLTSCALVAHRTRPTAIVEQDVREDYAGATGLQETDREVPIFVALVASVDRSHPRRAPPNVWPTPHSAPDRPGAASKGHNGDSPATLEFRHQTSADGSRRTRRTAHARAPQWSSRGTCGWSLSSASSAQRYVPRARAIRKFLAPASF